MCNMLYVSLCILYVAGKIIYITCLIFLYIICIYIYTYHLPSIFVYHHYLLWYYLIRFIFIFHISSNINGLVSGKLYRNFPHVKHGEISCFRSRCSLNQSINDIYQISSNTYHLSSIIYSYVLYINLYS